MKTDRRKQLDKVFENIDSGERDLIAPVLDELVYLENRMNELKKMPFINVHPKNPMLQKPTAAAKQYKECSQSYANYIRILSGILHKTENDETNELLKRLEEYDLS